MKTALYPQSKSFEHFKTTVKKYAEQHEITTVCEIGAGANPILSEAFVRRKKLRYTLYDKNKEELDKARVKYPLQELDFCMPNIAIEKIDRLPNL